jgi:lipopolysaccharide export system permease protein
VRTLHAYLTRQILASLLITVGVFTFVLLLGNLLKEILSLLVNHQATFGLVVEAVGLLIPFVWVFALPMGMLTATLLIFGRFSADQELNAVRSSGISLLSLVTPILLLSIALCAVSALVNLDIAPRCRVAYTTMVSNLRAEFSGAQLPEGRFIRDFPGYIFYVGKNRKGNIEDLKIVELKDETNWVQTIYAPRAKLEMDIPAKLIRLTLYDSRSVRLVNGVFTAISAGEVELQYPVGTQSKNSSSVNIDDMTFLQLHNEWVDLDRRMQSSESLRGLTAEQLRERSRELEKLRKELVMPVLFHMHRQVAFSFACFGFTLVGIPLGIRVHRRETNIGIAIALGLVAIYYSFFMVGQSLDTRYEWARHLFVWLPNFVFQAVGAVLLWRADRGI